MRSQATTGPSYCSNRLMANCSTETNLLLTSYQGCQMMSGLLTRLKTSVPDLDLPELHGLPLEQLTLLTSLTHLDLSGPLNSPLLLPGAAPLEQLRRLQELRLHSFGAVPSIGGMQGLRVLEISAFQAERCDLSSCVHLFHLKFTWRVATAEPQAVQLPFGPHVQLRSLEILANLRDPSLWKHLRFSLANLEYAIQLTHFKFHACSLGNEFWPVAMPALEVLTLTQSAVALPSAVQMYTNVRCLTYSQFAFDDAELDNFPGLRMPLPQWGSTLTHLKALHMRLVNFKEFPSCVLSLDQLETLQVFHSLQPMSFQLASKTVLCGQI